MPEAATPFVSAQGNSPVDTLTPRQRDVLGLIAVGKRNAEIGKELDISPRTVQIHVSTILKLLGIGNRTEAALLARKFGMGA
jgi:DNA-binding NarL/FixJ family response regulator